METYINFNNPFEGDTFIKKEIIKIKEKFKLKYCIETGCQHGSTTIELYDVFGSVITIEADENYYESAKERLSGTKINILLGRSEDCLKTIAIPDDIFYYLDAHGCDIGGCPLKKELEVIASKNHKNVCIAIHDFKVPGKDFGYDTYDFELCYEEIEPYLKNIYPNGFEYHYNDLADGAERGIIYIYPKK